MSTPLTKEQNDLIEILKLLEETFSSKDTKKIEEARNKLKVLLSNEKYAISLLFQALSISSIENKNIPINLHKSVVLYLKNIFTRKSDSFDPSDLFEYLKRIFNLILFQNNANPHLYHSSIFIHLQNIITIISSSKMMIETNSFLLYLFDILLKSINSASKENFLKISRIVILLCTCLLTSKSVNFQNYEEIINKYYMPIVNKIFANVKNYIDPNNNKYNNDFISVLKYVFDGFYTTLTKMRGIVGPEKRKEISFIFFREYGLYSFELLQLMPPFDEATTKKYEKPNPIIVFNADEKKCYEINNMKSKAIQFLSFITQISTLDTGNNYEDENRQFIEDKDLVELINKINFLIMNCFLDILNNKEKYYLLRRYNQEVNEEDDCFNILLFQICVFLTRSLIREPIKSEFSGHIKQFLLNILFPMITTVEDEKDFLDLEPDGYHIYINDILSEFKIKNFRTAGCFLINKICERFDDMFHFVSSFSIEMFNYIINQGKIKTELGEYNVYLKNTKDALINQFNDKIKLDFSLLIILILKEKIKKNQIFKNRLREIMIENQDKIHSISSPIIKIKLCKIYNYFLPKFFKKSNDVDENIKKNFIQKAIDFLLNNIIQNNLDKDKGDYVQALSYEASDTISELMSLPKSVEYQENQILFFYISQCLEKNFELLNKLIENVDVYSFFLVIDQILDNITINQRSLVFECISNLSKKFQKQFLGQNSENKLYASQYFTCINSFLSGKNGLKPENKEEINKFNEIFDPILNYIKNPKKFQQYEDLVSITEDYIKVLKGINERSALVLKNIKNILDCEKTTSSISFNFTSTFLYYIQKNVSDEPLDQTQLFHEILIIIQKSFSFIDDSNKSSKIYALLLTLQILNLNPNLPENILNYLIYQSINSFQFIEIDTFDLDKNNINQLSLANIALGFIYKPDLTFNILKKEIKIEHNEHNKTILYFDKFYHLIYFIMELQYPDYNPLLGKCIILGICGILTDKTCLDYLKSHKENKINLLNIFIKFVFNHKNEKTRILSRLMKKELKCNFVEDEDIEEDEEEEEEEEMDSEFGDKVENILANNDNINNCDEFKYFTQVMKFTSEKDTDIYNYVIDGYKKSNILEELFKVRNIKIKYNNKEFMVPRKTVKIIRKNK
jgi:hypothetical protein